MTYPTAFHRRWAAADWSNRHSNCNFFPDYKIPNYTTPHHFIHLEISLCHNVPSNTFRRQRAETGRQYSLSGRQVAIPVACQSRDCVRQLGIPSCRGPNLEIGAIPRCRTTDAPRHGHITGIDLTRMRYRAILLCFHITDVHITFKCPTDHIQHFPSYTSHYVIKLTLSSSVR